MVKKTKVICTLGPATDTIESIEALAGVGMNVARFNFSHGTHEQHLERVKMVREVAKKRGVNIGLLADTKGPEIRVGSFEDGGVFFEKGDHIQLYRKVVSGTKQGFHVNQPTLFDDIKVGDSVLVDDGKMHLVVIEMNGEGCVVEALNDGFIKNQKGVNVPNVKLSLPFISEQDEKDIIFACENKFDMIALSFVRRVTDIQIVKEIIDAHQSPMQIIAKIENQESYDNIDDILDVVDGIMVARGDLGVEVHMELVPIYQKHLIERANAKGKAVITATHMMESMMQNPQPTRAEASDVANAILDGTDAVMLSGETAAGKYPYEAARAMALIAKETERIIPYETILRNAIKTSLQTVSDVIGIAVSQAALSIPKLKVIVAFTETGGTAKRLSKFRPSVPIIAICHKEHVPAQLSYYWGIYSAHVPSVSIEQYDEVATRVAKSFGFKAGDMIAITSGWLQRHGSTNTLRIIEIK